MLGTHTAKTAAAMSPVRVEWTRRPRAKTSAIDTTARQTWATWADSGNPGPSAKSERNTEYIGGSACRWPLMV